MLQKVKSKRPDVLGVIPARAGSKGLPGKNVRLLAGQSLIEHAYRNAKESETLAKIILSTDDPKAIDIAKKIGLEVPFIRPDYLCKDDTSMLDVIIHALGKMKEKGYVPEAVMILQPTSPFRTAEHIRTAVNLLNDYDSVISVVPIPKTLCPHYVMRIREDGLLDYFLPEGKSIARRQDVPQAYTRDGTIYLSKTDVVLNQRSLLGERCFPFILSQSEALSIDDLSQWNEAEKRKKLMSL